MRRQQSAAFTTFAAKNATRRGFLAITAAAILTWPLTIAAQQAARAVSIGILANHAWQPIDSFRQRLRELGYLESKNVRFEYRYAEGRHQRFRELADDLVALKVDIIVTWGTEAALAAKRATSAIPIVMGAIGDPIAPGVVSNLARPGGNITGLSAMTGELEGKRLEFLREIVSKLSRVAVIVNLTNHYAQGALRHAQNAAEKLHLSLRVLEVQDTKTLDKAFDTLSRERPQALLVISDQYFETERQRLAQLALEIGLPSAYTYREHVEAGGLLAYTPSYPDLFRRAAGYVDKILKGTKPGDLPIEQPTKFELIINLKTAKALRITIPQSILLQADEVIE